MPDAPPRQLDAVIFGGGCAGLWLLDQMRRDGYAVVLLESNALGSGQTAAAQGIIHGGLKYTLKGMLNPSAKAIRDMPTIWRQCLAGQRQPDLSATKMRSQTCHLWRTESIKSRVGMIGAKAGLIVAPQPLERDAWPDVLADCPGQVLQLDEQVIDPVSFTAALAAPNSEQLLKIDRDGGVSFELKHAGQVETITLHDTDTNRRLVIKPNHVILTAGGGNEALRQAAGLDALAMQRRPLHVVMLRGDLPTLNGHCVDGARTRVTITTDTDSQGRTIWQAGGQVSEDGVDMDRPTLLAHARREIEQAIPGIEASLAGAEWSTYRVDRAERAMPGGRRPENAECMTEGNVITGWPTKLALAPQLSNTIIETIGPPRGYDTDLTNLDWPRPKVAQPPWETETQWITAP